MAIAANSTGEGGILFAKFMKPGDTLIGSFGGGVRRQMTQYKTNVPLFKDDGKPKWQEIMHFVAMPGTQAVTGNLEEGNTEPIEVGQTVRYAVNGFQWGQVIDARKALPAYSGLPAGTEASGDVYTITMTGWSATTSNPSGAQKAGFTVVDGRIVMSSSEEHEAWIVAQARANGNTNAAKEYSITVRRPRPDEAEWEAKGDALFASKPWERKEPAVVTSGGGAGYDPFGEEEPF